MCKCGFPLVMTYFLFLTDILCVLLIMDFKAKVHIMFLE